MSSSSSKRAENNANYLPRGSACTSCRRRKMKCDGRRPVCGQCEGGRRSDDCEYIAGQEISTVQILEDSIIRLEARIRELQGPQPPPGPVDLHQPYRPPTNGGASGRAAPSRSNVEDPPKHIAEALLSNFMPYATDFGFFLNMPRFRASMLQTLPPGHPSRPAPCLIFAIYLWSIRISPDKESKSMEDAYMRRATQEAATALSSSHPQRVLHSMQAEVLLSTYFFAQGRFLEGKYHVANAVSTALSAGFHKLRSANTGSSNVHPANPALPAPRDATEEGERIVAAWTVFNLDKAWAVALDSNPNFVHSNRPSASDIDTPWPLEMEDYEQGRLPRHVRGLNTVQSFLASQPTSDPGTSSRALEAKAVVLWDTVTSFVKKYKPIFSNPTQQSLAPLLQEFTALSNLLDVHISSLPPVIPNGPPSMESQQLSERTRRMLIVHSIVGAAAIRLHTPFAADGRSETSRRRKLDAARAVLGNLVAARGSNTAGRPSIGSAGWLNPIIGSAWIDAAQVLFDEIVSMKDKSSDPRPLISFVQQALRAMTEFGSNIPLMNFQVQKIQETLQTI